MDICWGSVHIWKKNKELSTKYFDVTIQDEKKKIKMGCNLKILGGINGNGLVWTQKNWKKVGAVFDAQHIWIRFHKSSYSLTLQFP